jgi:GNAT superfamily N-acetyltransferase
VIEIKRIRKKDVQSLLDQQEFWDDSFLSVSRHRLHSHLFNPYADDDDVVLLLAYLDHEIAGYMGAYIDKIMIDSKEEKIAWLSTWWVHPKTKGSGIGREILNTMYEVQKGKIGISQFTPSAKRVYDKSGYFTTLKESTGIKAVLKSDTAHLVPLLYPKLSFLQSVFALGDRVINLFFGINLYFKKRVLQEELQDVKIEYLRVLDNETEQFIAAHSSNRLSMKDARFFNWLKTTRWVEDAPLLELTDRNKYEFSMYDRGFEVYLMKIKLNSACMGFLVVQKRNNVHKLLYAYYDDKNVNIMAGILKLQAIVQDVREIVCYDNGITAEFRKSSLFLYKRKKLKQSIISKVYGKTDFGDVVMSFGDGDCSFA